MSYAQLKQAFKKITNSVWNGLEDAYQYNISFGETTISDMILLYLKKLSDPNIFIKQTKQNEESKYGTDWVWWIGSNHKGWIAFAVQAKKYSTKNDRYDSLGHKVNGISQSEILKYYAHSIEAIPIYALYNYVLEDKFSIGIKGLKLKYSKDMYGVTVTPLSVIEEVLNSRGNRKFKYIHHKTETITLPDLIKIAKRFLESNNQQGINIMGFHPKVHQSPLLSEREVSLKGFASNVSELKIEEEVDIRVFAKREVVINVSDVNLIKEDF